MGRSGRDIGDADADAPVVAPVRAGAVRDQRVVEWDIARLCGQPTRDLQVDEPAIRLTVRLSGDRHLPRPEDLPPGIDPPRPISVMFLPAKVFDNPALLQVNPEYLAWLLSLPRLERERLLNGNWKIRPAAGLYFKREWCAVADEVPADLDVVRYWDLAATEKTEFNDPDWTVGIKLRSRFRPFQYGPIVHKQPLLRSYPVIQRSNEKVRSHPAPCRRDTGSNPQSPELARAVRSYPWFSV
jgi:hypothetical protein